MMAIKLVSPIWNKTFLISLFADEYVSACKRRFSCLKMATFNAVMAIAGMMVDTADAIRLFCDLIVTIRWTFESVAIVMIVNMIAERGTFSVLLEKDK